MQNFGTFLKDKFKFGILNQPNLQIIIHCCFRVTTQYNDLETDEINILTGALRLKQKCVKVSIGQTLCNLLHHCCVTFNAVVYNSAKAIL